MKAPIGLREFVRTRCLGKPIVVIDGVDVYDYRGHLKGADYTKWLEGDDPRREQLNACHNIYLRDNAKSPGIADGWQNVGGFIGSTAKKFGASDHKYETQIRLATGRDYTYRNGAPIERPLPATALWTPGNLWTPRPPYESEADINDLVPLHYEDMSKILENYPEITRVGLVTFRQSTDMCHKQAQKLASMDDRIDIVVHPVWSY